MKKVELKDFIYTENSFEGLYGMVINNRYTLSRGDFKFKMVTSTDGKHWTVAGYKNDLALGELLADTPEELVIELNKYIDLGVIA